MILFGRLLVFLLVSSAGIAARYDPPSVVQPDVSPVIKAKLNDTIKITCPVRASPMPFLEWRKDQELVSELTMVRYNLNAKGSVLQIRRVECSDQGMFSCRGTNGYGSQEVSFQFVVTDGSGNDACQLPPEEIGSFPKILQTLPKKTKNHILQPAGSHVKLKCIADGTPEPRIIWLKDGREIKESKDKNAKPLIRSSLVSPVTDDEYNDDAGHTEAVRSTLQAGDLTAEDSGTYTCRAVNSIGFDERNFYLEVIELAVPQLPEVHADHPSNTTAVRGEQSMLTCKVKSDFPVDVYWLKRLERSKLEKLELSEQGNDTALVPNKTITFENNVYQILPSDGVVRISEGNYISKLGFQNPVEADSGFYVCLALNKIGMNFRGAYFYVAASSRLLEDYLPKPAGPFPEEPSNLLTIAVICSVLAAIVISVTVICIMWARNSRKAQGQDYLKPNGGTSAPRATPDSQTSSNKQTQSTSLGSSETGALIPHVMIPHPPVDYRFIQDRTSLPIPADSPSSFAGQSRRVPHYVRQMPVSAQVHYGERNSHHAHRNHSRRMPYYPSHESQSPRRHHYPSAGLKQHYCRVPRPTPETSFDGNLPY